MLVGAGGIAAVVLAVAVRSDDPAATVVALRAAALLIGAGAGTALDDPAAPTLAASPIGPPSRRLLQVLLICGTAIAAWLALLTVTLHVAGGGVPGELAVRMSIEAVALLASGLAVAALAIRSNQSGTGGSIAGPVLFVGVIGATLIQQRWPTVTLFPIGPADPRWPEATTAMAGALVVTVVLFVRASLDPGRPR